MFSKKSNGMQLSSKSVVPSTSYFSEDDYDYLFKVILLGEPGVGKSCLAWRFVNGMDITSWDSPPSLGYENRTININNKKVRLQILEIACQERYRSGNNYSYSRYLERVGAGLLVYDITNQTSFNDLKQHFELVRSNLPPTMLVGAKCDLEKKREVSFKAAADFAEENNLLHIEVSAKEGIRVEKAFFTLAKRLLEKCSPDQDIFLNYPRPAHLFLTDENRNHVLKFNEAFVPYYNHFRKIGRTSEWESTWESIRKLAMKILLNELNGKDNKNKLALLKHCRKLPLFNEHICQYTYLRARSKSSNTHDTQAVKDIDQHIEKIKAEEHTIVKTSSCIVM